MKNTSLLAFVRNPKVLLVLVLSVFFLKGVFLATVEPIFDGQDEARHYNSIQYSAHQSNIDSSMEKRRTDNKKLSFLDYNFSEEILNAGTLAGIDALRSDSFNTTDYSSSYNGKNETQLNSQDWKPINYFDPPDIVYGSFYHSLTAKIEKSFASQNILVRFFLIRIFSVLLGTLAVLLTYLIAKTIGFSTKHALILATILSFQPKFSMYFTNINYDVLLIPMFFLFTWAGTLALKKGLDWKNVSLFAFSIVVAVLTKPTGFILFVPLAFLLAWLAFEKIKIRDQKTQRLAVAFGLIAFAVLAFLLKTHLPNNSHASFAQTLSSVDRYLVKSLTIGRFGLSSRTYWGTLDWTNTWLLSNITNFIWIIQFFAFLGLGFFFFSKDKPSEFLPAKKFVVFLIGLIVALQLGIRAADWSIFSNTGSLDLGTPGRYFLPNLASHLILVFTGLGALLSHFKKERFFNHVLLAGLLGMFAFVMYLIFDVIIYRFYL